jgi:NADPH-dependent 2,4-dienoyl-CoA reductase/sulfur reductase-like enzyme
MAMLLSTGTPAAKRTDEEPLRSPARHRVVIVGGGFGGLEAAKELAGAAALSKRPKRFPR